MLVPVSILAFEPGARAVDVVQAGEPRAGQGRLTQEAGVARGGREVTGARLVCRHLDVADDDAERHEVQECGEAEGVVVDAVGKLERGAGALERRWKALPEALRPREAYLDARFERRVRRRLAQRLLEDRDGQVVVLELGEDEEHFGARRTGLRLGQQLDGERSRARPLACSELRPCRAEHAPAALVGAIRRREPKRLLGELGRERQRAASGRQCRRVVQHSGHLGVRRVGRERQVARTEERVIEDGRDPLVNAQPLVA